MKLTTNVNGYKMIKHSDMVAGAIQGPTMVYKNGCHIQTFICSHAAYNFCKNAKK